MKRIYLIFVCLMAGASILAQAPEKMSYQAVVRDVNGNLVTSQPIGMQISILQTSINGLAVYIERHTESTNANGLATLEIGAGTPITGNFANIDWANGPYFMKTETDPTGGTSYAISGTSQLLSVPYALYAKTAESAIETDPLFNASQAAGITANDISNWNNDQVNDADADSTNELQSLSFSNDTLSILNGNSVVLPYDSAIWSRNNDTVFYNQGNVGIGTSSPQAKLEVDGDFIRTIAYATGNGPTEYTDNGPLLSRVLTFTKRRDSTKVRISYSDNLRTYSLGGPKSCRWEMKIDGLSCPSQPLVYDAFVAISGENSHEPRTLVGYCQDLPAGIHQIQIWVGQSPNYSGSDCETGWPNCTWVIEVEEVN